MAQLVTHQFCVIGKAAVADLLLPSPFPSPQNSEITVVEDVQRRRLRPVIRNLCLAFYSFNTDGFGCFFFYHYYCYYFYTCIV